MLRCTSAGVSNCEVPGIRSNTVQRSPSTKISSWKSRATSLEESSRLFFLGIRPQKLTCKMLVFQLHQPWQYLLSIWISAGDICSHARKQGCQKAETVTQSCRKYQVIPMDFSRWALFIWRFLLIFMDFVGQKKPLAFQNQHLELKRFKIKNIGNTSQNLWPRRCAHLARRGGGIAVGCPGAMLGAAVPNKTISSGWRTHFDLQNNAKM